MQTNTPDKTAVDYLNDNHIEHNYVPNFSLDRVDVRASRQNQARIIPLDETVVTQYAEAMRRGDLFPAIVVQVLPNGKHLIVAGNHRHAAAIKWNKAATHPAYVLPVDTAKVHITNLMILTNTRGGVQATAEERVRWGIALHHEGMTISDAATIVGMTADRMQKAWRVHQSNLRCETLGVNMSRWYRVPEKTRERLLSVKLDTLFLDLAQFACGVVVQIPTNDFSSLVTRVNNASTLTAAVEEISAFKKQYAAVPIRKPRGSQTPHHAFLMHVAGIHVCGDAAKIASSVKDDATRDELRAKASELMELAYALITILDK